LKKPDPDSEFTKCYLFDDEDYLILVEQIPDSEDFRVIFSISFKNIIEVKHVAPA